MPFPINASKKKAKRAPAKPALTFNKQIGRPGAISFETAASGTLAALMLLVSAIILIGENAGVRVNVNLPEDRLVGPFQAIQFTFSEPFNLEIISELISIEPVHEGAIQWVNTRTMQYIPLKPYEENRTYTININPGEITKNGREAKNKQTWEFQVREPRVVYLISENRQSALWSINLNGDAPTRLTSKEVEVNSFDAASNGEFLIFTSSNEKGGTDLWRVGREGGNERVVLNCGYDRCTAPIIAPDNLRVAYSCEAAGPSPDPSLWFPPHMDV